jgi:hypothetical protein
MESADRRSRVIFHELSSAPAVGDMSPRKRLDGARDRLTLPDAIGDTSFVE